MGKLILIFSDGTGQIGGLKPDQRLSNVYKMYRAMRPGPDSPIDPCKQVAFYDAGLGAGETGGLTYRRVRNILAAAVGSGIDENVIDCYAAIIANYQLGDRICLFGFSRGAYTVRALANVLNVCGVPTTNGAGSPVPRHGTKLRKIASDGVKFVYNHGAGHPRGKYENQREVKARRFRAKYGSEGNGADGEPQGNVQPYFIGVFDTVAALGSRSASFLALGGFLVLALVVGLLWDMAPWWLAAVATLLPLSAAYWVASVLKGQIKYFFEDPQKKPRWWNPLDWIAVTRHGHLAWWSGKNYDWYVDKEIPHLRHALAIDECRTKFPRVPWARPVDAKWNADRGHVDWLKQMWFAGNHSDIGGSYPEDESRLSDVALRWMVEEFAVAVPEAALRKDMLTTWPDPLGLQHDEREALLDCQPRWLRWLTRDRLTWTKSVRAVDHGMKLHPSVLLRLQADAVPQMGEVKAYRPENLRAHPEASPFFGVGRSPNPPQGVKTATKETPSGAGIQDHGI